MRIIQLKRQPLLSKNADKIKKEQKSLDKRIFLVYNLLYKNICFPTGDKLMNKKNLILVDASALPEVFEKVLEAKKMLRRGEAVTVNDAAKKAGLSRSAFYKYKDSVFPFNEMQGIFTLFFEVMDIPGVLSDILKVLAEAGCSVLTINQNIPVHDMANITISIRAAQLAHDIDTFMAILKEINGVNSIQILSKEA